MLGLRRVQLKDLEGLQGFPSPGTREVNRLKQGKDIPSIWGYQTLSSPPTNQRAWRPLPWGSMRVFAKPLSSGGSHFLHSASSGMLGHLQLRASSNQGCHYKISLSPSRLSVKSPYVLFFVHDGLCLSLRAPSFLVAMLTFGYLH